MARVKRWVRPARVGGLRRDAHPARPSDNAARVARRHDLGGLVGWLSGDALWQRLLLGAAGAAGGYQAPALAVRLYGSHRRARIDEQFAPALVLMASGLQAGLSLPQALELAVRESPSPMADEFALVVKEVRLGARVDDALRVLPRRLPLEDVRMAVDAILTLRQTGGDLVSSFRVIAETVTERRKVEGRIRVITSDGLMQGTVMCLIPPVMLILFTLMDPHAVRPILATPFGWALLALVGGLNALGYYTDEEDREGGGMTVRMSRQAGQATADWIVTVALVALLAVTCSRLLFEPLRGVYRWAADCVTLDRCDAFHPR